MILVEDDKGYFPVNHWYLSDYTKDYSMNFRHPESRMFLYVFIQIQLCCQWPSVTSARTRVSAAFALSVSIKMRPSA
jgi:hypothetical protein